MAVSTKVDSRLQLVFENGVDPVSGNMTYKNKTFNNVKTTATPNQLLAISEALIPLQSLTLFSIRHNDSAIITAQ
ncbi:DUF1659 domain-containing protein [Aquibacillus salsiterrae]|uniref:DUF1659 domain-containing protein n=1 Tax=Aquibacillus salsiterrae TaxID=2950439 RepID=A0A9X3WFU2_9BACI|nr:DUF1659 domain-containing protein [Aquibacillus salsiterrae]MDC3417555.1 DUF1659 domain-containing protein [Aquibacillus salsiterrae]